MTKHHRLSLSIFDFSFSFFFKLPFSISICYTQVEGPAKHQPNPSLVQESVDRQPTLLLSGDVWISNQTTAPLDASDDGYNMRPVVSGRLILREHRPL